MASRFNALFKQYPILKGMATYAVLWPTSNICQQAIKGRRENFDLKQAARFTVFGTFFVAPSVYAWVKIAGRLVPGNTLRVAVTKALVEQVLFAPYAITLFYTGMTLLEGKSLEDAKEEVKAKFWQTYRTGFCIWPIVQTINFSYVKERNRVPVTSVVSFFWTVFLSYMKQLENNKVSSKSTC